MPGHPDEMSLASIKHHKGTCSGQSSSDLPDHAALQRDHRNIPKECKQPLKELFARDLMSAADMLALIASKLKYQVLHSRDNGWGWLALSASKASQCLGQVMAEGTMAHSMMISMMS